MLFDNLPAAETVNYWKSGKTDPDNKLDQVCDLIENASGKIIERGIMLQSPHEVVYLRFFLDEEEFKIIWPVLKPTDGTSTNQRAARIQAVTFVYHDVKAKCMTASVLGPRVAFLPYYVTENGATTSELATPELTDAFPKLLQYKTG